MHPGNRTRSPPQVNYFPRQNGSSTRLISPASSASDHSSFQSQQSSRRQTTSSLGASLSEKYSLAVDPQAWGSNLSPNHAEPDDILHNPDPRRDRHNDRGHIFTARGFFNLGCVVILCLGLLTLFVGYPVITYLQKNPISTLGGFNLGGINASGQVPDMIGGRGLIDLDTPKSAYFVNSYDHPDEEFQLVFSDEFNKAGRTFYPGDDPYWEAVDLHYWATDNLEWYDPSRLTTKDGFLEITLIDKRSHGMNYEGGMMSTWNKFCFTGGMILASVILPGANNVQGLWPAVWAMGNLGRAGYGATLDGMWPYSYDACDVGTLANQTLNGLPTAATVGGDASRNGVLSFLPGQRLSRCTCPGESHPGPMRRDGTYVGRAAPELDVLEAIVNPLGFGEVSMSAQWAPYNAGYHWANTTENEILTPGVVHNAYQGGVYQQTTSGLAHTNQDCYELETGCTSVFGFEYKPGYDEGYITWILDNKFAWSLRGNGLRADPRTEISARLIPREPMYIISNLGISEGFGPVDYELLQFPATMRIDWIRVYQPKDQINIGCDPPEYPTKSYIDAYLEAYTNPNYTTWEEFKQPWPKNRFKGEC